MKSCYCPNCGERQRFVIDMVGRIKSECPRCEKSLLFRCEKSGLTISVRETLEKAFEYCDTA